MSALNKVQLIGNVGKDPEIRALRSGEKVASFTLATTETWKDKTTGDKKEKTEWHNVVIFSDGLAGVVEKYVNKGSKLYLEGSIRSRKYEKDGQDRYITEIVLDRNGRLLLLDGAGKSSDSYEAPAPRSGPSGPRESFSADLDDEIPF